VLHVIHVAYADDGTVLEVSESVWPADRVMFVDEYDIPSKPSSQRHRRRSDPRDEPLRPRRTDVPDTQQLPYPRPKTSRRGPRSAWPRTRALQGSKLVEVLHSAESAAG
jgi:hypothetical protein